MRIVTWRSRQSLETSPVGSDSIDLVVVVSPAGERDPITPRRPRRERVEVRAGLELPRRSRRDIENMERPLRASRPPEDDLLSVGRPTRHACVGTVRGQGTQAGAIDADGHQPGGLDLGALKKASGAKRDRVAAR